MRLWLSGYRSYELSIFNEKDPKLTVLRYALQQELKNLLENGLEWIITSGQLGIEQWGCQEALKLKTAYPHLKIALMTPYIDFSKTWNEHHQLKFSELQDQCDFYASISNEPYTGVKQLQNYQTFMLEHTDQAFFVYDPQFEGKLNYAYQAILKYQQLHSYPMHLLEMDQLQEYAQNYFENQV